MENCTRINVGSVEDRTIAELAACVARVAGFSGRFAHDTAKPDGTPCKFMDVSRIKARGRRPEVDLPSGIALAYRDFPDGGHE